MELKTKITVKKNGVIQIKITSNEDGIVHKFYDAGNSIKKGLMDLGWRSPNPVCVWINNTGEGWYDRYKSGCGKYHSSECGHSFMENFKYCPYCGDKIEVM